MTAPRVLVIRAPGTNCDEETVEAWKAAGALPESIHLQRIIEQPDRLLKAQILTIPGGFSYGDDLGAGRIFGFKLKALEESLRQFHDRDGLIIGICNGFQVLVNAGLLPGGTNSRRRVTITRNDSGHFECRWIRLRAETTSRTPFLNSNAPITLPVAHAEGKFLTDSEDTLEELEQASQLILRYIDDSGQPTLEYPANPNGSVRGVAGITDQSGRIFGLMPHPERYLNALQHPQWTRRKFADPGSIEGDGLSIFRNAVEAFS